MPRNTSRAVAAVDSPLVFRGEHRWHYSDHRQVQDLDSIEFLRLPSLTSSSPTMSSPMGGVHLPDHRLKSLRWADWPQGTRGDRAHGTARRSAGSRGLRVFAASLFVKILLRRLNRVVVAGQGEHSDSTPGTASMRDW